MLTEKLMTPPIKNDDFERGTSEYLNRNQCDKLDCAVTGILLSEDMLEHIHECTTAKDLQPNIRNTFQRHTLLE